MLDSSYLREVTEDDLILLYDWANDTEVRNNSFQDRPFDIKEHRNWFLNKLASKNCMIYVYMADNIPIGQIRLEYEGKRAIINYSIDKNFRGQGHGKKILELAEQKVKNTRKEIEFLMGEVKKENIASRKKFEELEYEKTEVIKYLKKIK